MGKSTLQAIETHCGQAETDGKHDAIKCHKPILQTRKGRL